MEFARFFLVSLAGVVLDLSIAYSLHLFMGTSLVVSAAVGFVVVVGLNYGLHEIWTFRTAQVRLSGGRAVQFFAVSAAILLVRLTVVFLMMSILQPNFSAVILLVAAGVSFVISFLVSKFAIFKSNR